MPAILHDRVLRDIHLSGVPRIAAFPAIPARLARSFRMYLWDQASKGARRADALSDFVLQFGCWEGFETLLAMAVLDSGDRSQLVVDFGAQLGWYSLLAASFGYRTLALDEDAEQLAVLQESARLNGLDERIVPCRVRVDLNLALLDFDALSRHPPPLDPSEPPPEGDPKQAVSKSADAPTGDVPAGEAPSADAPAGEAPTGDAPAGEAPTADAPTGDASPGEAAGPTPIAWMKLDIEGAEQEALRASWPYFEKQLVRAAIIEITPTWACWIGGQIDALRRMAQLGYELYDIPAPWQGNVVAFTADPLGAIRAHRVEPDRLEDHLRNVHQTNFLVLRPEPRPAPSIEPGEMRALAALGGAEVRFLGAPKEIDNLVREVVLDNGYRLDRRSFARTGVAVDLGANVGLFALWAAAMGARQVICYEPHPETFALLVQNIAANAWRFPDCRFETRQLAVAGERGTVRLFGSSTAARLGSGSPWDEGIDVEAIPLAEVWEREGLSEVDVLKVDVEGAEYRIFPAAPEPLWGKIARVALEFHEARDPAEWGLLLARLAPTHRLETIGDPRRGGMLWAWRV